ncbi:MAG: MBL fold metallo-hydrolase [Desulfurobacteriaceae bacterium]
MENLKVIYDNRGNDEFAGDWGLSIFVELSEENLLFDTGAKPEILKRNMENFGIAPREIDAVFISHNHWDHVGGLPFILNENKSFDIFIPEEEVQNFEEKLPEGVVCVPISSTTYISDRTIALKPMETGIPSPRVEQSLLVSTVNGYVLLVGCSHPGILEIAKKATQVVGEKLFLIIGGFHLYKLGDKEIKEIAQKLKEFASFVAPCHCTGEKGIEIFKEEWKDNFIEVFAGLEIPLDEKVL